MKRAALTLLAAMVASTFAVPIAQAATSPSWSVMPSANPPARVSGPAGGSLLGVACATATRCFAVGEFTDASVQPLIGESAGANWSIVPALRPPDFTPTHGRLTSIACPGLTTCFAVGEYYSGFSGPRTLIERWNGKTWTIMKSPNPPDATEISLTGIACPSVTSCFAVGSAKGSVAVKSLIERWNGKTWSLVSDAKVPGVNRLSAVACASRTSCIAVGDRVSGSLQKTFAQRWNGKSWTAMKTYTPARAARSTLTGVACPSAKLCFAVGNYSFSSSPFDAERTLVERTNGEKWSVAKAPEPNDGLESNRLNAITCQSPSICVAVGTGPTAPVEMWNGVGWRLMRGPEVSGFYSETLNAVTCAAVHCIAVGGSSIGTLIAQRNGELWPELVSGGSAGTLASVSCSSATACFAVGGAAPSFPYYSSNKALSLRGNGTSWALATNPPPVPISITTHVTLADVSCASETFCVAVGTSSPDTGQRMLIERWDGTRWTVVNVPDPPGIKYTRLQTVSCGSPTSCFAVGEGESAVLSSHPFIERWNGTRWAPTTIAVPPGSSSFDISSVSCPSPTTCFAVGSHTPDFGVSATLVERWDGTAWSIVASPNGPGAVANELSRVSCATTTSCVAVGSKIADSAFKTLIEHWDGTSWSIAPSPTPPGFLESRLTNVSCASATSCMALGTHYMPGVESTLIERWDGTSWTTVSHAKPAGARESRLWGIFCLPDSCIAVGSYDTAISRRTLVERYA